MSDSSCGRRKIAGFNQFVKLAHRGKAIKVWLASDADFVFAENIRRELSGHKNIVLDTSMTSKELADLVGVDVPTAVVTETD